MSYLEESLAPGEVIVAALRTCTGRPKAACFCGILLIPLVVGIFGSIYEWLRLRSIELGVTNRRVVRKTGIMSRETEELRLSAIETVDLSQTTWGRLLGYGDVRVTGRGESSFVLSRVVDPVGVKRSIETAYAANVEQNFPAQRT